MARLMNFVVIYLVFSFENKDMDPYFDINYTVNGSFRVFPQQEYGWMLDRKTRKFVPAVAWKLNVEKSVAL